MTGEGSSKLSDLNLIAERGINLIVIAREGVLNDQFNDFAANKCTLIVYGSSQTFAKALQSFYDQIKY